jgi:2-haloacid dehalogenase
MDFTSVRLITFDCYGTLIDWESSMLRSMRPLFAGVPGATDEELLKMYSEIEPQLQAGDYLPYRRVLAEAVRETGKRLARPVSDAEAQSFAGSLKQWQPFPDTVAALQSLATRCKLAIVSNIDDDLFAATREHLKTDFEFVVTAQQVRSYKPSLNHFHEAIKRAGQAGIGKDQMLHAAQSLHHDIAPANLLGLKNVWVNRRFGRQGSGATRSSSATPMLEVHSLGELAGLFVR